MRNLLTSAMRAKLHCVCSLQRFFHTPVGPNPTRIAYLSLLLQRVALRENNADRPGV